MMRPSAYLFLLVSLLSCSENTLPTIHIDPQDQIPWDRKAPAVLTYVADGDSTLLACRLKFRGGSSAKYWKHSYRIELEDAYPLGGLPTEDDWVLNATHVDKTFLRHRLSYELFRSIDETRNLAPHCRYVEVSEADRYEGLYVLMQRVNGKFVGLNKKDGSAALYKDPPIFRTTAMDEEGSAEKYEQRWPKPKKRDMTAALDEFKEFVHLSADSVFSTEVGEWVDLENVIDWHLLLLFSNNGDGLVKNFYLYKQDADSPYRIAIWDYDHSFGRDGDYEINMMERMLDPRRNVLLRRLMDTDAEGYNGRLASRWRELRDDRWSRATLSELIEAMEKEMRPAISRNAERWPYGDERWYTDANTHQMEVDSMLKFISLRGAELDRRFAQDPL